MSEKKPVLLFATVLFGIVLTIAMMVFSFVYLMGVQKTSFERQMHEMDRHIQASLEDMRDELRGLTMSLYANEKIDGDTLRFNTEHTFEQHPAIRTALVALKVADKDRNSFEMARHHAGFIDYQIHDAQRGDWQVAGQRPYYFPVFVIEPFDVNHVALLGLDVLAADGLTAALSEAVESTADVGVVQDIGLGTARLWLFKAMYSGFSGISDPYFQKHRQTMVNGFVGIEVDLPKLLLPKKHDTATFTAFSLAAGHVLGQKGGSTPLFQLGEAQEVVWWSGFKLWQRYDYPLSKQHIHVAAYKVVSWFSPSFLLFYLSGLVGLGFTGLLLLSMRALVKSEARNRNILDSAFEGVLGVDNMGRVVAVNPAAERIFGCIAKGCLGCSLDTLLDLPLWNKRQAVSFADFLRLNPKYLNQLQQVSASTTVGRGIFLEVSVSKVPSEDAQPMFSIFVRDITQKKTNQQDLARLAMVVEQSFNLILITDTKGVIQYVNPAFERTSGFSAAESIGHMPNIVKSGEHGSDYYRDMWEALTLGGQWSGSFTNRSKAGALYYVEQSIFPMKEDGQVTGYVSIQQDVTEKNRLQTQSEHAQRLESLGVLAGGIAHDFNNLLTAVMGHAGLALKKTEQDSKQHKHLAQIMKASESAAALCQQMLAYSGKGAFVIRALNLTEAVQSIAQLLSTSVQKHVEMQMKLDEELPFIEADEGQIQQVMMNLIINASESMDGEHGVVEVETALVWLDDKDMVNMLADEHMEEGSYVMLRVSDTGCGMHADTLKKIFDPFFTTKLTGRGLGMSALLGIVRGHHGGLRVSSKVGEGTVFEVFFPVAEVQEQGWKREVMKAVLTERTSGTVLVIDDEEVVRDLATMLLEDEGLQVITAHDGVDGLEKLHQHQSEIDVVLLDMTMPKMSGDEFYKEMRLFEPEMPVVVSSGYAEQDIKARFEHAGSISFIQKPYDPDMLAEKIMAMLKA